MKKFNAAVALLLVLMMVFVFAGCGGNDDEGSEAAPAEQSQPADSGSESSDSQESSVVPESETSQEAEEEEGIDEAELFDEEEEPEEAPVQEDFIPEAPEELTGDHTGSFKSDTGTSLNLDVKWATKEGSDGNVDVTLYYYLNCYSLQVSERSGNKLEVETSEGTKTFTFGTNKVIKSGNTLGDVYMGQTTFSVPAEELASGIKVKADWNFKGSYSGTDLPVVTAEGEISQ